MVDGTKARALTAVCVVTHTTKQTPHECVNKVKPMIGIRVGLGLNMTRYFKIAKEINRFTPPGSPLLPVSVFVSRWKYSCIHFDAYPLS